MQKSEKKLFEKGHLTDDLTADYADALANGNLPPLPEQALEHVQECMDCKDKVLEMSMFLRNPDAPSVAPVLSIVEEEDTPMVPRKRSAVPLRIAATFVLGALLLGAYFLVVNDGSSIRELLFPSNASDPTEVTDTGAPVKTQPAETGKTTTVEPPVKTQPKPTPPQFRVNPNLENMIGTQYRSAGIHIIAPENNSVQTGDILFEWKNTAPSPLTLKIITNRNHEVFSREAQNHRFTLQKRLTPGLYYWKLQNHNDLLYIGKFFVRKK